MKREDFGRYFPSEKIKNYGKMDITTGNHFFFPLTWHQAPLPRLFPSVGCLKKSLESCCCILSSSHPLQALQRGVWSPQTLSEIGGETYLQRVSVHLRSSPTLKRAENNLDPNIWIAVKCLRLSEQAF